MEALRRQLEPSDRVDAAGRDDEDTDDEEPMAEESMADEEEEDGAGGEQADARPGEGTQSTPCGTRKDYSRGERGYHATGRDIYPTCCHVLHRNHGKAVDFFLSN